MFDPIARIVYPLIAIVVGTVSLKYNYQFVNNTFRLEWVEGKLGPGSTYLVYKVLSILLVLGGILYMTFGNALLDLLLKPIANLIPR